jgi:hypothetical protein
MDDIGAENLPLLLADWGEPISTPSGSGLAVVDRGSQLSEDGRHVVGFVSITGPRDLLEGLAVGDAITVAGVAHVIEQPPLSAADGALLMVRCRPS